MAIDPLELPTHSAPQKTKSKVNYCGKKLTYLNVIGLGLVGYIYHLHVNKGISESGSPATFLTFNASERLFWSCVTAGILEVVGFVALNHNLTSLAFAMVYLFAVTRGFYDSAFIISRSYYSQFDDFNQVIEFAEFFYRNKSSQQFPDFISHYQRDNKCCGWGKYHWMKWAKELNMTDLPDSCCIVPEDRCGKGMLPRRPSGYLSYLKLADKKALDEALAIMESNFQIQRWDSKLEEINRYWTQLHPSPAYHALFNLWNPKDPVSPWYLRLIDEEFVEDSETITDLPIVIGRDNADFSVLFYFTKGLEEQQRIQAIVHNNSCESTLGKVFPYKLPDRDRGVDPEVDVNILMAIAKIMTPVRDYGIGLGVIYFVMFFVFFYYFQEIKAVELATDPVPVDFQDTEVTSTCFMSNPKHYLNQHDLTDLKEKADKKRDKQAQEREELETRYHQVIALHETGEFLKKDKVRQPVPPENPNKPADVHRYQKDLLGRLPARLHAIQAEDFAQDPEVDNPDFVVHRAVAQGKPTSKKGAK